MNLLTYLKPRLFKIAAIICTTCFLILLILKCYFSLSYLPDISGSENSSIFPIQLLRSGQPIYTDPETAPFRFTQYTPLYFILSAKILEITKWLSEDVHRVFLVSRFISIGLTLASSFVVYFIICHVAEKGKIAGILAACFVYQILSYWFLTNSRPDSLLVLLTAFYILSVFKAIKNTNNENWWWILAIIVSVTAFFVKQSAAIHSITLACYCLQQQRWKLLALLIFWGVLSFTIYLLILPVGNLPVFFSNIVGGVANTISWAWFYDWTLEKLLLSFAPLLILNVIICLYYFTRVSSPIKQFLSIASIMFFLFASATGFKVGSGVGYYQDFLLISVIQITLFLTDAFESKVFQATIPKVMLASYLVLVSVHCTIFIYMTYSGQPLDLYKMKYVEQNKVANYLLIEKKLSENDWVYMSESQNFDGYFVKHFLFKNILVPFPDIIFLADKSKKYNFNRFRKMADEKKIKYVIAKKGNTPENILGYEFKGLIKTASVESYDIYEF